MISPFKKLRQTARASGGKMVPRQREGALRVL
jgi:hypothetical protein